MKRLIVNADDFGLTESVNRGILDAHRRGILTSTTMLANGAAFGSAVKLALATPRLGVGVHLNLTQGRPISDPRAVASLVNKQGYFCGGPTEILTRILTERLHLADVEHEWRAQIEKVRGEGMAITHLDGHKHVQMLPPLFRIVLRLAREYGISGVRLAAERPVSLARLLRQNGGAAGQLVKQYLGGRGLAAMAMGLREPLQQARLKSPMYFYGIMQTGFLDRAELEAILWNLPEGTSELMCHPGYADGALPQTGTRLLAEREREVEALTRVETRKLVAALGIQLIDYRDLATIP